MKLKSLYLLVAILAIGLSKNAKAQSFAATDPDPSYYIVFDCSLFEKHFYNVVTNVGNGTVHAKASREEISLTPGHNNNICWNGKCYPPNVLIAQNPETLVMAPNDTTRTFTGTIRANNIPGIDVIRYCFFDTLNPVDSTCIIVTYECQPTSIFEAADQRGVVSEPFPNPASDRVNLGYELKPTVSNAEMLVFDAQGRLLDRMKLSGFNGVQAFETTGLDNGLYFMQVRTDGSVLARRQFVVSH